MKKTIIDESRLSFGWEIYFPPLISFEHFINDFIHTINVAEWKLIYKNYINLK